MKRFLCFVFLFSTQAFAVDLNNLNYSSPDGKFEIKNCGLVDVWSKTTAYIKCLPQISVRTKMGAFTKTVDLDLAIISGSHAKCFSFDYRNSKILIANSPSYNCANSEADLFVNPLIVVTIDLNKTFVTETIVSKSDVINLNSLEKIQTGDKIFFIDDNSWIFFGMHGNNTDLKNFKTYAYVNTQPTPKLVSDIFVRLDLSKSTFVPSFTIKGQDIVSEIDQDLGGGWRTPPKGKIDSQGLFLPN